MSLDWSDIVKTEPNIEGGQALVLECRIINKEPQPHFTNHSAIRDVP